MIFFFFQVVVQGKGEICLAAAEVYNAKHATLRQIFKDVIYDFKVSVYLAELAVCTGENLSVLTHHSQLDEKVAGGSVGDDVIFCFVVGKGRAYMQRQRKAPRFSLR